MLKTMRSEINSKCAKLVRSEMKVDGLIGEGCPYSTFSNFINNFYRQTSNTCDELKLNYLT